MKRICGFLLLLFAGSANAITITFGEDFVIPDVLLDNENFYDSYGVSFESAYLFGPIATLPDDGYGIANAPGFISAINFSTTVDVIDFTWAVRNTETDFWASAYDTSNQLVDSFFFDSRLSNDLSGVASLTGLDIMRMEFTATQRGFGAIDTLSFYSNISVPEPTSIALLLLGLVSAAFSSKISRV